MLSLKRILLLCSFLVTGGSLQSQIFQWAKGMGGQPVQLSDCIAVDSAGNSYTTGYFRDSMDFDPGPGIYMLNALGYRDIFIVKLNANGNFVWAIRFGGSSLNLSSDRPLDIAVGSNGSVYSTGQFRDTADFDPGTGIFSLMSVGTDDIYISRLDSAGNFIWAKQFSGPVGEAAHGIVVDTVGNVYTTGIFFNTVDFDPGPGFYGLTSGGTAGAIFISKLNVNGNFVWAKRCVGVYTCEGTDITLDLFGNVYVVGLFAGSVDFDPGSGQYTLTAPFSDQDIFIQKLSSNGAFISARHITSGDNEYPSGIRLDAGGNMYVGGYFSGTGDFDPGTGVYNLTSVGGYDVFVLKLNWTWGFMWAKRMGGAGTDEAYGFALDSSGNAYTTGRFLGTSDFDPGPGNFNLVSTGQIDAFVSKLDSAGNFGWAIRIGALSPYGAYGNDIGIDLLGNFFVTGNYSGTTYFNPPFPDTLASVGNTGDVFVAKYGSSILVSSSKDPVENNAIVYPNPTTGMVTLDLKEELYSVEVIVSTILGQELKEYRFDKTTRVDLEIEGKRGLYFVKVRSEEKTMIFKILKQ